MPPTACATRPPQLARSWGLDSFPFYVHVLFVNTTQAIDPAGPASCGPALDDPSSERREGCVCGMADGAERAERRERHLGMLRELGEIGMKLARAVGQKAVERMEAVEPAEAPDQAGPAEAASAQAASTEPAAPAQKPGPDLALVFARLSLAVRQTVALEARIAEGKLAPMHKPVQKPVQRQLPAGVLARLTKQAAEAERDRRHRHKDQVSRIVTQAIEAEHTGKAGYTGYHLEAALSSRLEDEDVQRDIGRQPLGAIAARICRDLRLDPDWRRWEAEYWALEEIRTKATGSPYAEWDDEEEDEVAEDEDGETGIEEDAVDEEGPDKELPDKETDPPEPARVPIAAVEAPDPLDPLATPDYAAIRDEARDYLRSVFSGERSGGARPRAMGRDPPSG